MKYPTVIAALFGLIAAPVWAANGCSAVIEAGDGMQYNKSEITVPKGCDQFTVELEHVGKLPVAAMGHNWVLTTETDKKPVLADAMKAGADNAYLKPGDARVIAHTRMLGGGESDSVTFDVKALGDEPHVYFCSFPGHESLMHGTLFVE